MVTRPELDVPFDGLPLLALRLAATVILADLSYRYIEKPIRRGALGRSWRTLREAGTAAPAAPPPVGRRPRAHSGLLRAAGRSRGPGRTAREASCLASMKSVHTVEQTHPASSTAGTDSLEKDRQAENQNSGEIGDALMARAQDLVQRTNRSFGVYRLRERHR